MSNILEDVLRYVADKLNADPQLSACHFIAENRRDVEFEIKQALGKQGVVGLVMTPKATFAGAYMDTSLAWQLDELEVDVVENVLVNRGKKSGYITGQDAAMRLFDVLCPLSGEHEGQFSPVSYDEGEDGSLLVNKCVLKCLVHVAGSLPTPPPFFPDRQAIKMSDGTVIPMGNGFFSPTGYDINTTLRTLGYTVNDVEEIYVFSKLESDTAYREYLKAVYIDSSCPSIGKDYWSQPFSGSSLEKVVFKGRTYAEIAQMEYYPWGLTDLNKIIALDDTPIPTKVEYTTASGLPDWEADIVGQLSANSIPNMSSIQSVDIGNRVTSIASSAFSDIASIKSVVIPEGVKTIGSEAFYYCETLSSVSVPDSVTSIGDRAFYNDYDLLSATIGTGVTSIGEHAFRYCGHLSALRFKGKTVEQVQAMQYYPWGIEDTSVISAELG